MARTGQSVAARPPTADGGSARRYLAHLPAAVVRERFDPAELRSFARSSPARLIAMGLLLIGLCLAAGTVASDTVGARQEALDVLLADTEPDADSAHRLYTTLSIADAAASTAFISGGVEPESVRDRYTQAIGEAAAELVIQSGHVGGGITSDVRLRTGIATGLPVYTGLIETARTNNRIGNPVGAAYLSEASNQMQTTLLPMAEELQDQRSDAVDTAQRDHVRPPWTAIALLILALTVLVWAQVESAKRWRRTFNAGLLLASAAMAILLGWTVIAGSLSATAMIQGRDHGAVPASRLTESRILAQQARSAETLKLVRRDATGDYDRTFDSGIARLDELLGGYPADAAARGSVAEARAALARWRAAHQRMNDALAHGDFQGAALVATGQGAADSAAQVEALDRALGQGIAETRQTLRGRIARATGALTLLAPGATVLAVLATIYIGLGVWPRLREYR
ncbi:hypothetical protein [Nocardia bovistercoris]|uniref:Secreted protein n=1 Tax=Nocardia bovistercoris TaxID=2785916 RepID=A0A931IBS6_9NOCA|nr:hypothetical protein [Nocardia bovistercoris]MBH0778151.1 hypothetical protein [Nocardia bovistercoris]